MAQISSFKEQVIIPLDYNLLFVDLATPSKSWTFKVPEDFPLLNIHPNKWNGEPADEDEDTKNEGRDPNHQKEPGVHLLAVCEARNILVLTTTNDKSLYTCKIADDGKSLEVLSRRLFHRTCSRIVFAKDTIVLADKTGEVYEYDLINVNKPGRWIFAHMTQILDCIATPDEQYVITTDRDEKIRLTDLSKTHEIAGLCFGHLQFVSAARFLNNTLLTISGDQTMRAFNYLKGVELQTLELPCIGIKMEIVQHSSSNGLMAILSECNKVHVFKYNLKAGSDFEMTIDLVSEKELSDRCAIISQQHPNGKRIITVSCDKNNQLVLESITEKNNKVDFVELCKVNEIFPEEKFERVQKFQTFETNLLMKTKVVFEQAIHPNIKRKKANR